ncbi:MAG: tetratricopeptide repeat protein [Myxococcales bacterium]|nr:tetratricopeptide repeat protein [Myxococcales bacterium]
MKTKIALLLIAIVLAGCVYAAYWNAPKGDFIWDDINLIVLDYQIKSWNFLKDIFARDFFGFSDDNRKYGYYRPLVTITYALDWRFWQTDPAGYHWTNLLIHYLSTVILFLIFYRLANRRLLAPTIAALLFAVHPIHTESVTWIAGRTDPLCALFYFASFLAFQVYTERLAAGQNLDPLPGAAPHAARRSPYLPGAVSLVLFAFSLLAKEMAVSLPVVSAAYLFVYVTGIKKMKRLVRFLPILAIQIGMVVGYFLFRYFQVGFSKQAKDPFDTITAILSFIKTIGYYSLKMLVPVHLSAYLQNPLVESVLDPAFLAGFVFLALLIATIIVTFTRDKLISFSLLFYLASLLPISNFIRISGPKDMGFMTAERFLYIPSAPFILVGAIVLGRLIGRLGGLLADCEWPVSKARRLAAGVVTVAMFGSFTALTIDRNVDWYSNERLFTQMIADAPNATLLYVVLGNIYRMNKKYAEAEKILNKALEYIAPRDREEPAWIYNDLAGIYAEQRRFDEALQLMKLASRTRLHNSAVLYNYGEIYRAMGDCKSALEYYQRSLVIYRDNRAAFVKMGLCYQQEQAWELANKAYFAALNLTPHSASLLNHLGYNYLRLGNLAKAEIYLTQALREKPRYIKARLNLSQIRYRQGKTDEAIAILNEILAEKEKNADAHAYLGLILAQTGKLPEAGPHIRRALAIDPKHIQARLTLATVNIDTQPQNARRILQGLLQDVPEDVEATFAMGLTYLSEKNNVAAAEWFEKTLKINPRHQGALHEMKNLGLLSEEDKGQPAAGDE